jgi:hypothetical protein
MRNRFPIFLAFTVVALSGFGQGFSIGGGVSYSPVSTALTISDPGLEGKATDHFNFGTMNAYLDAPFAQAWISYGTRLSGSYDSAGVFSGSGDYTNKETYLGISILFKYSFTFDWFELSPLVGVENDFNLSYMNKDGINLLPVLTNDQRDDLSKSFIKVGLCADFNISNAFYVRSAAIFGSKLRSKLDDATVDYYTTTYGLEKVTIPTTKFDLMVLVGYRFTTPQGPPKLK